MGCFNNIGCGDENGSWWWIIIIVIILIICCFCNGF